MENGKNRLESKRFVTSQFLFQSKSNFMQGNSLSILIYYTCKNTGRIWRLLYDLIVFAYIFLVVSINCVKKCKFSLYYYHTKKYFCKSYEHKSYEVLDMCPNKNLNPSFLLCPSSGVHVYKMLSLFLMAHFPLTPMKFP